MYNDSDIYLYTYPTHTHTHTVLMDRLSIDEYIVDGIYNGILSIHIYIYFIFLIFTELFLICMLLQCYSPNSVKQTHKILLLTLSIEIA